MVLSIGSYEFNSNNILWLTASNNGVWVRCVGEKESLHIKHHDPYSVINEFRNAQARIVAAAPGHETITFQPGDPDHSPDGVVTKLPVVAWAIPTPGMSPLAMSSYEGFDTNPFVLTPNGQVVSGTDAVWDDETAWREEQKQSFKK